MPSQTLTTPKRLEASSRQWSLRPQGPMRSRSQPSKQEQRQDPARSSSAGRVYDRQSDSRESRPQVNRRPNAAQSFIPLKSDGIEQNGPTESASCHLPRTPRTEFEGAIACLEQWPTRRTSPSTLRTSDGPSRWCSRFGSSGSSPDWEAGGFRPGSLRSRA